MNKSWGARAIDANERNLPALKLRFVLDAAPRTGSLLEIGCGSGKVLQTLHNVFPELTLHGTDIRTPPVPPAGFTFHAVTDEHAPFPDATFDAVLILDVVEHVPNPPLLLSEAARVLKPGGALVAFIPAEANALSFHRLFRALLGDDLYAETKDHIKAFSRDEVARMLRPHFTVTRVRYCYHFFGQLMDAAFFAAQRLPRLGRYWWKENAMYHTQTKRGPLTQALDAAVRGANALAWLESTVLADASPSAMGMLIVATKASS